MNKNNSGLTEPTAQSSRPRIEATIGAHKYVERDISMPPKITLSHAQRKELERLWFIYGNNGKHHSHANHRFIQCFLEHGEDARGFFKPSPELLAKVNAILTPKNKP